MTTVCHRVTLGCHSTAHTHNDDQRVLEDHPTCSGDFPLDNAAARRTTTADLQRESAMRCSGWCGKCYAGLRGREFYSGHAGRAASPPWERGNRVGHFSSRRAGDSGDGTLAGYPALGEDSQLYPQLAEFLALGRFDDGSPRVTGTLLVFVHEGRLKARLTDREEGLVAFRTMDSLEGLLRAVELDLQRNDIEWRKDKDQQQSRRR